jgi:hypothetical protein
MDQGRWAPAAGLWLGQDGQRACVRALPGCAAAQRKQSISSKCFAVGAQPPRGAPQRPAAPGSAASVRRRGPLGGSACGAPPAAPRRRAPRHAFGLT